MTGNSFAFPEKPLISPKIPIAATTSHMTENTAHIINDAKPVMKCGSRQNIALYNIPEITTTSISAIPRTTPSNSTIRP